MSFYLQSLRRPSDRAEIIRGDGWGKFLYFEACIKNDGDNKDYQVQAHRINEKEA